MIKYNLVIIENKHDEATEEDFEDNAPGGNIEAIEIVYDEREK